ncbi:hypothetical protein [Chamaesiphon polymorphus]|jgi:hypothetical protein|uniref:Uncharacterized protein n=1 Tax=Chamaesiphon polymorphus CCALA 037 TaxID=2107692 RepID=A0A2T1G2Q5_9CYAN|nr:hypothetical protein [Chamaesiphon polymorphus]PSB51511.1 hypothetical protein C7B77_21535 [Chamaesiphon polymorphus CCALA 037]
MSDDLPKSIGEILRGDSSNRGFRHVTSGGASITVGVADDPNAPGGKYISVTDEDGKKRSIVYDRNGNVVKDTGWK